MVSQLHASLIHHDFKRDKIKNKLAEGNMGKPILDLKYICNEIPLLLKPRHYRFEYSSNLSNLV